MKWFDGAIASAIAETRSKKLIFVVFVGNTSSSDCKQLQDVLENKAVTDVLDQTGYVALKLDITTELGKQFSQIYPVVVVPCIYFIGTNGVPLEITGGKVSVDDMVKKLGKVLDLHKAIVNETQLPTQPNRGVQPNQDQTPSTSSAFSLEDKMQDTLATSDDDEAPSNASLEDKIERAKRLLAEKKERKLQEERELEKEKEAERRKLGQSVLQMKKKQEEQEFLQLAEERQKEKEEDRIAREKVKQQIAQDRADRAMRYQMFREEEVKKQTEAENARIQAAQEKSAADAAARSNSARLQFRMPMGSSVNQQFPADTKLEDVRTYIRETIKPSFGEFTLSTAFPRREFTEDQYQSTLRELLLAPSAALLVLPLRGSDSSGGSSGGQGAGFIWKLLSPLVAVFTYIRTLIFGNPPAIGSRPNPSPTKKDDQPTTAGPSNQGNLRQRAPVNRRLPGENKPFSRAEGNVYRIRNQDDDDENSTWNGNSTQQM